MFASLVTKVAMRKSGASSMTKSFNEATTMPKSSGAAGDSDTPFTNPFANITMPTSWTAWTTPPPPPVAVKEVVAVSTRAPSTPKLRLPGNDGRSTVVVFLRGGGCPFAEKTFVELRRLANKHPQISCIAISHASQSVTEKWVTQLGGSWAVTVVVDEDRSLYAEWGLGTSTTWHVFNPWTSIAQRKLGNAEGIWARRIEPKEEVEQVGPGARGKPATGAALATDKEKVGAAVGSRWQIAGAWAVDSKGVVRWGGAAKTADDLPDLEKGVESLGG